MPTYQYRCRQCDSRLEAVQSFTDSPLTECPSCGGVLRKVFSSVGVVFKGSGFYRNDNRVTSANGKSDAAAAKAEGAPESKTEVKTEVKGDSKTEAKAGSASESKSAATSAAKSDGKVAAKPSSRTEPSTTAKSA